VAQRRAKQDSRPSPAVAAAWRHARALVKRRKPPAALFREAAVNLCRNLGSTARELLGGAVKLVQSVTRIMASIRRDIEEAFGVKLTWAEIEDLKRKAKHDRAERDAAERRQLMEEWLEADRQRIEEERALEDERIRAIRLGPDPSSCASTPPSRPTKAMRRTELISVHGRTWRRG
jgi:hypothetical protein